MMTCRPQDWGWSREREVVGGRGRVALGARLRHGVSFADNSSMQISAETQKRGNIIPATVEISQKDVKSTCAMHLRLDGTMISPG